MLPVCVVARAGPKLDDPDCRICTFVLGSVGVRLQGLPRRYPDIPVSFILDLLTVQGSGCELCVAAGSRFLTGALKQKLSFVKQAFIAVAVTCETPLLVER